MRLELRCKVGYLVPGLLLLFAVTDVALRLTQGVWGIFGASSGLRRSQKPGEAFLPNLRFEVPVTYGDLARMANIRDNNETRSLRFSTDALGFRNVDASGPVAGILFGDSFAAAGDGRPGDVIGATRATNWLQRAATPPARTTSSGRPESSPGAALATRIGMAKWFVIVEQVERGTPVRAGAWRERSGRGEALAKRGRSSGGNSVTSLHGILR
jgi:hypothetical protein